MRCNRALRRFDDGVHRSLCQPGPSVQAAADRIRPPVERPIAPSPPVHDSAWSPQSHNARPAWPPLERPDGTPERPRAPLPDLATSSFSRTSKSPHTLPRTDTLAAFVLADSVAPLVNHYVPARVQLANRMVRPNPVILDDDPLPALRARHRHRPRAHLHPLVAVRARNDLLLGYDAP